MLWSKEKKMLKVLRKNVSVDKIGNIQADWPDVMAQATGFTAECYGQPMATSMSESRVSVWNAQIGKPGLTRLHKLASLPPTTEVFTENVKRAHLQLFLWKNALQLDPQKLKFGRKTVIVVSMFFTTVLSVSLTWVTSFYVLIPVVILMTACSGTQYLASFVFGLELVGHSKRMWAGVAINFFWSAGNMIVALAAFLLRDWKTRQLVLSVPSFIFLYLFFIPESPRWLLSKGKNERAKTTLVKIAESNRITISELELENITTKEESKMEYFWELFKSPTLLRRLLILFFNW
ncbi:organic cation transporter-like protein [Haliotis rubra]|uniref:organic cation transporter-like protein n=1 Tax=Haliotis rubra TaxID=36100 RepID=UPI001EE57968|nr:organic cation transporter-like protein [Haliotis rubra]